MELANGISALVSLLRSQAFTFSSEDELQRGIETLLQEHGIDFQREAILTRTDRIDFFTGDGIGIEVKTGGTRSSVIRQLHRYASLPQVRALILVTSRANHNHLPAEINHKPLVIVSLVYRRAF